MNRLAARLLLWGSLLFALACAPGRSIPPAVTPAPAEAPASSQPQPAQEAAIPNPRDTEEASREIIAVANGSAQRARDAFERGQYQPGREHFEEALRTLRESAFDFVDYPHIERAYSDIQSEYQQRMFRAVRDNPNFPLVEPADRAPPELTPLEEIAEINLYGIEVNPKLRELVDAELLAAKFDVPLVVNDAVLRALDFYQKRGRGSMEKGLRRVGRYQALFERIFAVYGVPSDLIYLTHVESLFNPRAYSRARAKGLWQFTSGTGRFRGLRIDWWIDERSDVVKSTHTAASYLKELNDTFGSWNLALAAYNAGPGRLERTLRRHPGNDYWQLRRKRAIPRETRNFVPLVTASIIIFHDPARFGFDVEPDEAIRLEEIAVPEQVDLRTVAKILDMKPAALADFNPELRRGITPFDMPEYRLKVPEGTGPKVSTALAALPPEERLRFAHHRVNPGETLGTIARRYRTSIGAIAQVNRIRNVHRIKQGQDLMIPMTDRSRKVARQIAVGPGERYVVRRGDTLARIARRVGISLRNLLEWNRLTRASIIHPGQRLKVVPEGSPGQN